MRGVSLVYCSIGYSSRFAISMSVLGAVNNYDYFSAVCFHLYSENLIPVDRTIKHH